jgi:hypothetical protein
LPLDGVDLGLFVADESARTLLRIEEALEFQFAVGADDGVGIDGDVDGELPDSRQLVAGFEIAAGNGELRSPRTTANFTCSIIWR